MTEQSEMPVGHIGDHVVSAADVAELEKLIGLEYQIEPGIESISRDVIRDYATYCVAHANPLWVDVDYARESGFPTVVCPPTVEYVASSRSLVMGGFGLHDRGIMALAMLDDWEFFGTFSPGDAVYPSYELVSANLRDSRWAGGPAIHQIYKISYRNQDQELISTWTKGSLRATRPRRQEKLAQETTQYRYTTEEIEAIQRGMEAEVVRGRTPRYVQDVNIGDSLGTVVKGPFTQMDMMCWWIGAKGPFLYPFRMKYEMLKQTPGLAIIDPVTNIPLTPEDAHWDPEYARRNGVSTLYDAGKQRTAAITHLVTNWMGDHATLRRVRLEMRAPNALGDTTWYAGEVTERDEANRRVVATVTGTNQRGLEHCRGLVEVELPQAPRDV